LTAVARTISQAFWENRFESDGLISPEDCQPGTEMV
jgi:hypothetical protein